MSVSRFNVRVYGLLVHHGKVLLSEEKIQGQHVVKFPGGGLQPGEGTLDCLRREIREEMGVEPIDIRHFYTTDFFQQSAYRRQDQIISIYYLFNVEEPDHIVDGPGQGQKPGTGEVFRWHVLANAKVGDVDLPIDRVVMGLLLAAYKMDPRDEQVKHKLR